MTDLQSVALATWPQPHILRRVWFQAIQADCAKIAGETERVDYNCDIGNPSSDLQSKTEDFVTWISVNYLIPPLTGRTRSVF